ncbi:MAG: SemiSWEET transporter [Chloracidobacterium sp.]|uniref:SemiSWEET transporter n=1 Tax=Chloracidobacterium validum TaxID=2821543 RepID=A0ABX8BCD8_9BACT|nr:SemiSWEET transporter [Chloracidobacterium validum]QUW03185.1 SemiSWEET transporter [Chloracidobacterium validum]
MLPSTTLTTLGLIAGALTSFSFALQVWRSWRTKSVKDVSASMYVVFSTGVILWLVYGMLRHDVALIVWNALTLVLVALILALKVRYTQRTATDRRALGTELDHPG